MFMVLSRKKFTGSILSREQPGEKGLFLKRIGMLLEEGYSIKECLTFLLKIEKGAPRQWIEKIQAGLMTGSSFHTELEKLGFSSQICAQIYLAAQFGNYSEAITQCGEYLLDNLEKQKKLRSLLAYPLLLLLFLLGMLFLMRTVILPHVETLFMSIGSDQDVYANAIVLLVYYSPQIILGTLLLVGLEALFFRNYLNKKTKIEQLAFLINIPPLTNYLKDYYTQFFFFEWGTLFYNGCSFQEIITIMQGEDASQLLQETGQVLADEMKLGNSITEALQQLPFFHEEAMYVVTHGENLGKLSTEMLVYASYCETRLNNRVEKLMGKIQPLIFSFVALMIIAVYAALMLPIFSLMEGL